MTSPRLLRAFALLLSGALATPCVQASASLADALDRRLEEAEAAGFSGQVLVADAGGVVYERQLGLADPAAGTPVTADTRFNLASTGKMFTAVAVMQLVEQGKLDLDAPIGRYLPDWPVATVREKVTARQLLIHTSGLGSYWGPDFESRRAGLRTLADHIPLLATEPDFEPGTGWQYSNSGFMLLGLLVEAASGEDYHAYVGRHVFGPAGMADTGYFEVDGKAPGVARPTVGGTRPDRFQGFGMPEPRGAAAGGGYSTARDLLAFHRALTGGKLLGREGLAQLFAAVQLPAGVRAPPHGQGVLRYATDSGVAYGHPGGARGVGVDFRGESQGGWMIAVLSNSDQPFAMPVADGLLAEVRTAGGPDLRFPGMGGGRVRVRPGG
ncbi:MAG: beta-lactamase family protein [Rhizobium sp.]|nr:beta-lactamase family protein [Rhizobium sp.]